MRGRSSLPGGSSPPGTSPSGALFKKVLGAFRKSLPKHVGRAPGAPAPETSAHAGSADGINGINPEELVQFAADYQKLTSKRVSSLREL
jgi:hypothetical protein